MYKKIVTMFCLLILLGGCGNYKYQYVEQPHLYRKDIEVTITNINRQHWFAITHRYIISLTVQSEEYGLTKTFQFEGSGAFGCPPQWNYNVGDIVKAKLYSWVLDSTGEVIQRKIYKIY